MGNTKKALDELQKNLIGDNIPIATTVIPLCLAIGYVKRYTARDALVRWGLVWSLLA
ncbi:hypothetical protein [Bartonella taylorii]|uniref:hypothetical protein n=1 Tax=Bartonella taylorii TaxID=33046 RepID=UPI00248548B8|nr:hypothetical protein [Bartonella taylorii]